MHKLTIFKMSVALVASLLSAQSTFAQGTITSFEAAPQLPQFDSRISLSGSFGRNIIQPLWQSTMSAQLDLNANDRTATFQRVTVDVNETIDMSRDFDVDEESVTISGSVTFDSTLDFFDNQPIPLRPATSNQFYISGSDFLNDMEPTEQTRIIGNYEFRGPTESVEGDFSVSPSWVRRIDGVVSTLDTHDGSSQSVTIRGRSPGETLYWITTSSHDILARTIDGVDVSVRLGQVAVDSPYEFLFKNAGIIPEPSEYALMIGGLLIAFVAFRRMRVFG